MPAIDVAFADFDYYTSSANAVAIHDLVTRIDGSGSLLLFSDSSSASEVINFAPKTSVVAAQGLSLGIIQIYIDVDILSSNSQGAGLLCMQSQRDMTTGGSAYGVVWRENAAAIDLFKCTNGLDDAANLTILSSSGLASGQTALQLGWVLASDLSSVSLVVSAGIEQDYSDLMVYLTYQDTTNPLTAHVTEGAFYNGGGSSADFSIYMDLMTVKA